MNTCELCGKYEDERAMPTQCGYSLCRGCAGAYTDKELMSRQKVGKLVASPSDREESFKEQWREIFKDLYSRGLPYK